MCGKKSKKNQNIFLFIYLTYYIFFQNQWIQNLCLCQSHSAFDLIQIINFGGRSIVYNAVVNKKPVIIKKTTCAREIKFLELLKDVTGIVKYMRHFVDDEFVYIVLAKNPNTIDLYDYITKCEGKISETLAKNILKQLIFILLECKSKKVLHNDIKETNILINPLTYEITLIDFDAAEIWCDDFQYSRYLGTWQYSCPEWHIGTYSADNMCTWQIGVLMYSMLCGQLPFECHSQIAHGPFSLNPITLMSKNALDFLNKCLDKNKNSRIKLNQMLDDEYFI
ncbi:MAG: protein kinase [Chryseobacterium sp.]